MSQSVLESDDSLGFCTFIETTKSRLFSRGINVTSEVVDGEAYWLNILVPTANSPEFVQLRSIIGDSSDARVQDLEEATPILIEVQGHEAILGWTSDRQAKFASGLVNRFLRAYEHTYFDMRVPRHRLDGREIVMITPQTEKHLEYTPVTLDLTDLLEHYLPSHMDIEHLNLELLMGSADSISPSWRILIDGARHFENGNLREAVLCACSAAEIVASPAVERWLDGKTLKDGKIPKGGNGVRNAVREMGNPLRFDLCISGACSDAFLDSDKEERADLLADLRRMNSLRNAVVHQGEEPEATAAAAALRASATFVCKSWLAALRA